MSTRMRKESPLCRPLRPSVTLREAKGLWAKGAGCYRQSCVDSSAALRMTVKLEDIPQRSWLIPATMTVGSLS